MTWISRGFPQKGFELWPGDGLSVFALMVMFMLSPLIVEGPRKKNLQIKYG